MNNISSKLFGLFLIFMGVGYLGSQFDLWSFTIFFRGWWACIIVLVGICSMLDDGFKWSNVIITGLGIYFFLTANDFISFRITFQFVLAVILILVGVKILFFRDKCSNDFIFTRQENEGSEESVVGKKLYVHSTFGTRRVVSEDVLDSCRIENIFGSVFLDLRKADLSKLDRVSLECVFGTLEIIVPSNVNLNVKRENVFASCYVDNVHDNEGFTLNVKETCIFGTVRITKAKK